MHSVLREFFSFSIDCMVLVVKIAWMRAIAMNWARFGDCNVCAVDWSRLANYDYSIAAMHHTKDVADFVARFMKFLMKNGMDSRQVSIVGHSLGKHAHKQTHADFMYDLQNFKLHYSNKYINIVFRCTNRWIHRRQIYGAN